MRPAAAEKRTIDRAIRRPTNHRRNQRDKERRDAGNQRHNHALDLFADIRCLEVGADGERPRPESADIPVDINIFRAVDLDDIAISALRQFNLL